jgi:hypothetical protein
MDEGEYIALLKNCSNRELVNIREHIDSQRYPERLELLLSEIESRKVGKPEHRTSGWKGPIRIKVRSALIWPIRGVFSVLVVWFGLEVYEALESGIAFSRDVYFVRGEHWGYYASLGKDLAFLFMFSWLSSFGTVERKADGVT